jgi:hypothetical protein
MTCRLEEILHFFPFSSQHCLFFSLNNVLKAYFFSSFFCSFVSVMIYCKDNVFPLLFVLSKIALLKCC